MAAYGMCGVLVAVTQLQWGCEMSHGTHEVPVPDEVLVKLEERQGEIAGTFPEGKLSQEDEGALAISIGLAENRVMVVFPKPISWLGMSANDALLVGEELIEKARQLGHTRPLRVI
jgi:hypothetical protein